MFLMLLDYCNWNWPEEVEKLLKSTPGMDITEKECECIRLAIARNSPEILRLLLEYFNSSTPGPIDRNKIREAFDEYINFEDLSSEMMKIVCEYLPHVAKAALVDRAANDDAVTVRILYQYFPETKNDILEVVVLHKAYNVIDALADMQSTPRQKAILYRNVADSFNIRGILSDAYNFYATAIRADPEYIIPYIHYANNIVEQQCSSDSFDGDLAEIAEEFYKKAIEFNPKYSSAYKKLGILYQKMSDHESHEDYAIKAFKAYVDAIRTKSDKLKYDSVYKEIEHIFLLYPSNDYVRIIAKNATDSRLQEVFSSLRTGTSDDASSDTSEILREMSEEDLEYEETDMDSDLMGVTSEVVDS